MKQARPVAVVDSTVPGGPVLYLEGRKVRGRTSRVGAVHIRRHEGIAPSRTETARQTGSARRRVCRFSPPLSRLHSFRLPGAVLAGCACGHGCAVAPPCLPRLGRTPWIGVVPKMRPTTRRARRRATPPPSNLSPFGCNAAQRFARHRPRSGQESKESDHNDAVHRSSRCARFASPKRGTAK